MLKIIRSGPLRTLLVTTCLLALVLVYLVNPIYGFLSHKEKIPHLPIGWLSIPSDTPMVTVLEDERYSEAAKQANAALSQHRKKINAPAISAAVSIEGKRIWATSLGWSDIDTRRPATLDTQFRIGSTSKALTATVLGRLLQEKKISLDEPLREIFSSLPNEEWASITPRHLATHTSGIPHYGQVSDIDGKYRFMALNKQYENALDALNLFDQSPLLFEPGSQFSYSSLGTVLLSASLQEKTGSSFQELITQTVLSPLKMQSTTWHAQSTNMATPYWQKSQNPSTNSVRPWRKVDLSHRLAGGGFLSTPSDLVKLGAAYLDQDFLETEVVNRMWQPQTLANGNVNEQNYAIGWRKGSFIVDQKETATYHHGGVSRGGQSWLFVVPEHRFVLAINTNINTATFSDFASVYREITRSFIQSTL